MEYKIINGVVIDNKGRQIKDYREFPYGFGHFLSSNISLEGVVTATSSMNHKSKIFLSSNKKYKNNPEQKIDMRI